jgi:hypothetical protein
MPDQFTYKRPDSVSYLKAVLAVLKKKGYIQLHEQLAGARCAIETAGSYSGRRWDAEYTTVVLEMPVDEFDRFDSGNAKTKQVLLDICNEVMPAQLGLDVMEVRFVPLLNAGDETDVLDEDLLQISNALSNASALFPFPIDILEKGQQMTEVYAYLYAVENYLRLFIESVAMTAYGQSYMQSLNIPRGVKTGIANRKAQEAKNQWIVIRGNSDLFYLDFKDLSDVITNNWDLFRTYFPDQSWISTKIDELANCRNLVAHNSFLGDHERDVIRVNFRSIARQLNPAVK